MDAALLIARLLLAAVFFVAAFSKLADLAGSRQAMAGFGIPERCAGLVGLGLPLAELAIALLLVRPGATIHAPGLPRLNASSFTSLAGTPLVSNTSMSNPLSATICRVSATSPGIGHQ